MGEFHGTDEFMNGAVVANEAMPGAGGLDMSGPGDARGIMGAGEAPGIVVMGAGEAPGIVDTGAGDDPAIGELGVGGELETEFMGAGDVPGSEPMGAGETPVVEVIGAGEDPGNGADDPGAEVKGAWVPFWPNAMDPLFGLGVPLVELLEVALFRTHPIGSGLSWIGWMELDPSAAKLLA